MLHILTCPSPLVYSIEYVEVGLHATFVALYPRMGRRSMVR
jgi:hypothetical protein